MEMLLVTQMIAVHVASMNSVKLMKCTKSPDYDHGNIFNKLARTYMNQLAMLQQYRSGPEPKLTVHNVSVNDGGQAIVGHVTHKAADKVQPPPIESPRLVADQSGMAMPVIEQDDQVVATAPLIEHDQEPDPIRVKTQAAQMQALTGATFCLCCPVCVAVRGPARAAPVDRPRFMANAVVACMVVRLGLAHHLETRTPLNTGALLATKWLSDGVRLNYCGKRARRSLI